MDELLNISHYILDTKVLGPYLRSALWVNGCCFSCAGCIAEEMNHQKPVKKTVKELSSIFLGKHETEGITISGGEPFLQSMALAKLIDEIRSVRNYGVIIYTGFTLEELREKNDASADNLLNRTDILIDGRYQNNFDDGRPYRGSSNQRIILLTDRYKDIYERYYLKRDKRDIEIRVETDHVYMVGVPSQYGLKTWKDLKKRAEGNVDGI